MNPPLSPDLPGHCALLVAPPAGSAGIARRTLLSTPTLRLTCLHFTAGRELPEHTSQARALVQVLSGAGEFSVGGIVHSLRAGDLLHLPPGLPHAVRAATDFSMLLTQVTEPAAGK